MTEAVQLCALEEIEDGEGKGFVLGAGTARRELFVVREGRRLWGYVNACPHVGTPLDWQPDRFLSADGGHILCATHGALFEIETGRCVSGPCAGDSLTPLPVALDEENRVWLLSPGSQLPCPGRPSGAQDVASSVLRVLIRRDFASTGADPASAAGSRPRNRGRPRRRQARAGPA